MKGRFIDNGGKIGLVIEFEGDQERILGMCFCRQNELGVWNELKQDRPGRSSVTFGPKENHPPAFPMADISKGAKG